MQTAQDAANKQERPVIMATTPTPPAPTHLGKQHVFSPGKSNKMLLFHFF